MSRLPEWNLEALTSLRRGNYTYFPVVPGRVEFAAELRRRLLDERPDVIALELPPSLQGPYLRAVRRLPQMTVLAYEDDDRPDEAVYLVVEPADPFTEAIRTGLEIGAELVFAEPDTTARPHLPDEYPDTYAVRVLGYDKYVELYRLHPAPRSAEVEAHAAAIAWKLQGVHPLARVFVVLSLNLLDPVLDAMERPQEEPPPRRKLPRWVELINPHPECLAEITIEYPFLQERYEQYRISLDCPELIDRPRVQLAVFKEAEAAYERNTGEKLVHWQRRLLARYTRNLALIDRQLTASLFDMIVAARSIVDDNYAWEVWEVANRYLAQQAQSDVRTERLSGEEVWLHTRKVRLRRRLPRPKQRLRPVSLKPRKKERFPGEWAQQIDGDAICSYPPEDIVIEEYAHFLKQKAKSVISEERMRVEPFTTSMLDGIDIRETIRNWFQRKIYVRVCQKIAGEVGAVIVIFDEDRENRYNYLTTWLGEHENESDMAFYATNPFDHLVGPGIGRAEYGGFLMSWPPRRMWDVWSDPDYDLAETKPERLLLAGLDYSPHRYVVYVAARPPRSIFRSIAARMGRTILYIPIGQLSPTKLKKIRVVHVLDSHERRKIAKDYIW